MQPEMGARGTVEGEGESGGGQGASKDHQGFWQVAGVVARAVWHRDW